MVAKQQRFETLVHRVFERTLVNSGQYYVQVKEDNVQFAEDYNLSTSCLYKNTK